jgi:protein-disulfide isomerase
MTNLRGIVAAVAIASVLAAPVMASASEFSAKQREEIGSLVREYLINHPEVLREAFDALEKKRNTSGLSSAADELYRQQGDLVAGNPDGKVTLVEFFDYNCGYCKRSLPDVLHLLKQDKDLKLIMKEWPILGPGSIYASRAALASRNQGKYWEFHMALMSERHVDQTSVLKVAKQIGLDVDRLKADMNSPAVLKTIKANMATADTLGIQGTPAFVIGDELFPGAVGFDKLSAAVDKVREDGGCKIC